MADKKLMSRIVIEQRADGSVTTHRLAIVSMHNIKLASGTVAEDCLREEGRRLMAGRVEVLPYRAEIAATEYVDSPITLTEQPDHSWYIAF